MLRAIFNALFFISIFIIPHKTFGNSVTENPFQELINMPCDGFLDLFSPPKYVTDLKKEVDTLKEKLEKIEHQQKETPDYAKSLKIENGTLKAELEEIKAQQKEIMLSVNASKSELQSTKEEQTRKINDLNELERILIHYGNNQDGMSALHYAIKQGDVSAVNTLIVNGADVNSKDGLFTTLTRAASCNKLEIVQILLNFGADVNLTACDDWTPYAINYVAESGSGELITLLIENGAIIDKTSNKENPQNAKTPLHTACRCGNYDAVLALIKGGAKINGNISPNISVSHWNDGTPLDWAANSLTYKDNPQNLELIKFLVENGARRHAPNKQVGCCVINGYLQSVGR